MSIRIRTIDGRRVALCAARSVPLPGDLYLDDADHYALAQKFAEDFQSEGIAITDSLIDKDDSALRSKAESNNQARTWWDSVYGPKTKPEPIDRRIGRAVRDAILDVLPRVSR